MGCGLVTDPAVRPRPYAPGHAERPATRRPRHPHRDRPRRHRRHLLGRAGEVAARLLPGASGGLEPSPRQARHRSLPRRARLLRVRLVPDRAEALDPRRVIVASLITYPQAIILGLLQGVSELFPISSLGHSVILPMLLGFFWRDWVRILKGLGRSLAQREIRANDTDARLGWLLVVGTIPAGILG